MQECVVFVFKFVLLTVLFVVFFNGVMIKNCTKESVPKSN